MLMTKALGLHNHAIRRAMHSNAGHVLEQEGDSYAIAFYDPMEAVAFCLQVCRCT
jgi:class 3 adenylate cyclase